jgi:hypothetical protein
MPRSDGLYSPQADGRPQQAGWENKRDMTWALESHEFSYGSVAWALNSHEFSYSSVV